MYLLVFIRNLLVHLAEKILLMQPLTVGGDYPWMQDISINAYKMPYEATPDRQDLAIREFADSVMTGCLESLQDTQGSP